MTPPARRHCQVPALQTPTWSNPCALCFPHWGPGCSPQSCPRCQPVALLLPSPFPEERASLAGWQDVAGCLSFHAFSLLLFLSPGSSSSSPCDQLSDQHAHLCPTVREAETWGSNVVCSSGKSEAEPRLRRSGLSCATHPCVAGDDARSACLAPYPSTGAGWGDPCPWPGSSAALAPSRGAQPLPGSCHTPRWMAAQHFSAL